MTERREKQGLPFKSPDDKEAFAVEAPRDETEKVRGSNPRGPANQYTPALIQ